MVKLKESNRGPIRPDRYYFWTWRDDLPNKYATFDRLYRKHLTTIPYFSRHHIKLTLTYMYGYDVLKYIHIISGRKLLKQGIRSAKDVNPYQLGLRKCTNFRYKGQWVRARKFIIPDEYRIDSHRRRRFMVQMHRVFKSKGKKAFDERYSIKLYGHRRGISYREIYDKRVQIRVAFIQELQKAEQEGKGKVQGTIKEPTAPN